MEHSTHRESALYAWVIILLLAFFILIKGVFTFFAVGDLEPTWDSAPLPDVPGESAYAVYPALPYPQHIRGAKGRLDETGDHCIARADRGVPDRGLRVGPHAGNTGRQSARRTAAGYGSGHRARQRGRGRLSHRRGFDAQISAATDRPRGDQAGKGLSSRSAPSATANTPTATGRSGRALPPCPPTCAAPRSRP